MVGRKKIECQEIFADFTITSKYGATYEWKNVQLTCPDCKSTNLRTAGTRKRKDTRVQGIICANDDCRKNGRKNGRQFTPYTSGAVDSLVDQDLEEMISMLYLQGAKGKTVAKQYGVSSTFISFLRDEVDEAIERGLIRDSLVDEPTDDTAVSIDEMFFKIGGKTVYVIIVRGYKSRKVLGLHVSNSRKEPDIRKAFDEAQQNTIEQVGIISMDAWGATRKMAYNLLYPVTLIVHKHKKPYDKAVIERVEYDGRNRIIIQIGVKTDIFTKQKKREFRHRHVTKCLIGTKKRPLGRPKGSKNKPKTGKKKTAGKEAWTKRALQGFQ